MMKLLIFTLIVLAAFAISGCAQKEVTDAHGCVSGYTWCEANQVCLPAGGNCTAICTQEEKTCPDGSMVGRTGPDCAFAPCPNNSAPVVANTTPPIVGNDSDAHGCKGSAGYTWCEAKQACIRPWEEPCEGNLTDSQVMAIAQSSECAKDGNLSDQITFNSNSDTYWIDMSANMSGCSPACVVYENGSADVNWRCTGLIEYTVKAANSSLGGILTDNGGYTLYTFAPDTGGLSTCYGTCEKAWPPLLAANSIEVPADLQSGIGVTVRSDNTTQVTYGGMPLYTYIGDSAPGETNGQGVGGVWNVVQVNSTG